jgi:hypothetical protein
MIEYHEGHNASHARLRHQRIILMHWGWVQAMFSNSFTSLIFRSPKNLADICAR